MKPPKDSSEQEQKRFNEELEKAKPTATRYLYLIRHGQFNVYGDEDKDRILTEIGEWFSGLLSCYSFRALKSKLKNPLNDLTAH